MAMTFGIGEARPGARPRGGRGGGGWRANARGAAVGPSAAQTRLPCAAPPSLRPDRPLPIPAHHHRQGVWRPHAGLGEPARLRRSAVPPNLPCGAPPARPVAAPPPAPPRPGGSTGTSLQRERRGPHHAEGAARAARAARAAPPQAAALACCRGCRPTARPCAGARALRMGAQTGGTRLLARPPIALGPLMTRGASRGRRLGRLLKPVPLLMHPPKPNPNPATLRSRFSPSGSALCNRSNEPAGRLAGAAAIGHRPPAASLTCGDAAVDAPRGGGPRWAARGACEPARWYGGRV
jgi:hypothetical protein